MNILFICSAKKWGGNEKWTSMAMQGLALNHKVFFLGKNPELLLKFGPVTDSYSAPFKWNFDLKTKSIIAKIVKDNKIDLIVSTKKKEYFLAGLVARKFGIKHFLRLGIVRDMKIPYWSKLLYYRLNDGIVVNAQQIKTNLLKYSYFKDHPIEVVYNGVPDANIPQAELCQDGRFIIVSTGMLTQRKGFHLLIEAISNLPSDIKQQVKLHVVGEGREEFKLKKMVKDLNLQDIVFFEGFSHQSTSFLKQAQLFALISENEGISNAVIEAMYAGVPVLTTSAGGVLEFLEDEENAFLTTRNVPELAVRLEYIIRKNRNDLFALGAKGQVIARSMFNMDKMNNQLASFLLKK
ncbi:glycosyltransferase [Labilibacter sediminis]|nr:glycosyltransferase [Labilibacter sediminis]